MFDAALMLLATLGQVRELDLAGERLAGALKVTGRYKNVGKETVKPEFKVLVYDAEHALLASGLTALEPREIRAGGTATMTGLVLDLPAAADCCEAVMVLDGEEITPIDARRLPLSKHARDVAKIAATVAHVSEDDQEDIFRDFFRRLPEATAPAAKLPRAKRRSFINRAIERLYRDIAKEYHVTAKDVANVIKLGVADGWERPDNKDGADEEYSPFK